MTQEEGSGHRHCDESDDYSGGISYFFLQIQVGVASPSIFSQFKVLYPNSALLTPLRKLGENGWRSYRQIGFQMKKKCFESARKDFASALLL